MMDFMIVSTRIKNRNTIEIYPKFIIKKSKDLMIRGGDFYAVWVEETGLWSTDEQDALQLIDRELDIYAEKHKNDFDTKPVILHMWDAGSGMIDAWHKYCQKQMRDSYHLLDDNIIFANAKTKKEDYASHKLNYPFEKGDISAYESLINVLYSEEERRKIEWAIGAIISGDSKTIQKFIVLYGAAGTGKSTILNIIQKLFDGYFSVFDAKALGSSNNVFALESFKNNPLVAIQHDGDLSRIEDNTRLNSLTSHELMTVNEKFKSTYTAHFRCFLFMGTNKPVKITDAKSGLIRRLIDISPTGEKVSYKQYKDAMKKIDFELGAIAHHCLEVYESNKNLYDNYIPINMLGASNDFYNFVKDSELIFKKEDCITLKSAWEMYKVYCDESKIQYPFSKRIFKEELKNYFYEFKERHNTEDGQRLRNCYVGYKDRDKEEQPNDILSESFEIDLREQLSILDDICRDCPAQYATTNETPKKKWADISTTLKDLDTRKLHFLKLDSPNHIVIDFDLKDENGNKSLEKNIEEASKWPPTYAETSKSGNGLHLHYYYSGDVEDLGRLYSENIEVKVYTGNSSLRRKLFKCNNLPIALISSGLPMKGGKKVVDFAGIKSERALRGQIIRNLNKEIHPNTKPSIDFIYKILEDAYNSGLVYDVSDMKNDILNFALTSTHQAQTCLKIVNDMKFKSEDPEEATTDEIKVNNDELIFYDVEVFPNLFILCWKKRGKDKYVVKMINPKAKDIEELLQYKLIGFNNRRYDNHILYARLMGYDNLALYELSQKIINGTKGINDSFFREAYGISYTDIYDFASAGNKKSLKKLEVEMGIHHQELGIPWDKEVPEELWEKVADYCCNDVYATEAAFEYLEADYMARLILSDIAGMTPNDTTNTLTTRIIFGTNRTPQTAFMYRDLSKPVKTVDEYVLDYFNQTCPEMIFHKTESTKPYFDGKKSVLPYFDGYSYSYGKSVYRGEDVGEGGYVYAEPGMYTDVALLDITSMHPHSIISECLFGVEYTSNFKELVDARVAIKHEEWDKVSTLLGGKLKKYVEKVKSGEITSSDLANALKTAINSVYGLTSASFSNAFRDDRNIDNIVAKRGALFMVDLKKFVQDKGYTVAHIKTDSIKIPNADPRIIKDVVEFGRRYGYFFEHEATYERMCLVNDAVYVARYATEDRCKLLYDGYSPKDNCKKGGNWTATGAQFQIPYIFKTLFSKEKLEFDDLCETKSVSTALYLDFNEGLPDVSEYEKELKKLESAHKKKEVEEKIFEKQSAYLENEIEVGHNRHFVGKVGQFCPVKPGCGGGLLMREKDGKYYAATGSKGYRWLESEVMRKTNKTDDIDYLYFNTLVDEAVEAITAFGDFEWFVSDDICEDGPNSSLGANDGDIDNI